MFEVISSIIKRKLQQHSSQTFSELLFIYPTRFSQKKSNLLT